jgi:hypothetical protein
VQYMRSEIDYLSPAASTYLVYSVLMECLHTHSHTLSLPPIAFVFFLIFFLFFLSSAHLSPFSFRLPPSSLFLGRDTTSAFTTMCPHTTIYAPSHYYVPVHIFFGQGHNFGILLVSRQFVRHSVFCRPLYHPVRSVSALPYCMH